MLTTVFITVLSHNFSNHCRWDCPQCGVFPRKIAKVVFVDTVLSLYFELASRCYSVAGQIFSSQQMSGSHSISKKSWSELRLT